jgi:hypothetical protein
MPCDVTPRAVGGLARATDDLAPDGLTDEQAMDILVARPMVVLTGAARCAQAGRHARGLISSSAALGPQVPAA